MTPLDPRLLIPPQEEEEVYPYRRVWRSIIWESGIIFAITIALYVVVIFFGIQIPPSFQPVTALAVALIPALAWVMLSWRPEQRVPQPRQRLFAVAVITALAANAVGIPVVESLFQVKRWLPLSSAINRIVGYTFTVGLVQEFIKYIVLRYTVWDGHLRVRLDTAAYSAACAVGYATVLNLQFVLLNAPPVDVAAARMFEIYTLNLAAGIIVAYGLSEVRFGYPSPILLALTIMLASIVVGVAIPIRSGLVAASLSLPVSATKPLLGLGFSLALLVASLVVVSFLFANAERRATEAMAERDRP